MNNKIKPKYMYIVRKYVLASNFKEAVKNERKTPIHDLWLEDTSQKQMIELELIKNVKKVGYTLIDKK